MLFVKTNLKLAKTAGLVNCISHYLAVFLIIDLPFSPVTTGAEERT